MRSVQFLIMTLAIFAAVLVVGCPPDPAFRVTPAIRMVAAPAGTTTFSVSVTGSGTGTVEWTASVTQGADWLHIELPSSGTILARFDGNASPDQRQGAITAEATGIDGSPVTVVVVQSGVTGQGEIDLVGDWTGHWWINGLEEPTVTDWTFNADGTWSTQSGASQAEGTYVVDDSAAPNKIDIYVDSSNMVQYAVGTTYRGYYDADENALYLSQLFTTRLDWVPELLDPDEEPVCVATPVV